LLQSDRKTACIFGTLHYGSRRRRPVAGRQTGRGSRVTVPHGAHDPLGKARGDLH
jgi:hypothetical protein